jgi:GNAT superfamily N-acetyltransferase
MSAATYPGHDPVAAASEIPYGFRSTSIDAAAAERVLERHLPPLLQGLTGTSEATQASAAALEPLIIRAQLPGCMHTIAEGDLQAAKDEAFAAALRLIDDAAEPCPDVEERLTVYLRATSALYTPWHKWRQRTLEELLEGLSEQRFHGSGIATAALEFVVKHALPRGISPPVAAAMAAYQAAHEAHDAACTAYAKVEAEVFAGRLAETDPDYLAAEEAQGVGADVSCAAWAALMETPAVTDADLNAKLRAYLKGMGVKAGVDQPVERDGIYGIDAAARFLQADVERLGDRASISAPPERFATWEAEEQRLLVAAAGEDTTAPEGAARAARLGKEAAAVIRKITDSPCLDSAAAQAKLRWVMRSFTEGETGSEERVLRQVLAYLDGHCVGSASAALALQ